MVTRSSAIGTAGALQDHPHQLRLPAGRRLLEDVGKVSAAVIERDLHLIEIRARGIETNGAELDLKRRRDRRKAPLVGNFRILQACLQADSIVIICNIQGILLTFP